MKEEGARLPVRTIHMWGAGVLVSVVVALFFLVDRSPPIQFIEGSVEPEVITPGDSLTVRRAIVWTRFNCSNVVTAHIRDVNGLQHKQMNFSAPTPDEALCQRETREANRKAGLPTDRPICIVRSVSAPPARGVQTTKNMAAGPATYHVEVEFRCGLLGNYMDPIRVVAPPIRFEAR